MSTLEELTIKEVAIRIAGDIILSPNPGKAMRKWRDVFGIPQTELAAFIGVSASVISDYESGRRKSPGSRFVKKFVYGLIRKDLERGGRVVWGLSRIILGSDQLREAILDIREFSTPVTIGEFCRAAKAVLLVGEEAADQPLLGYTVVDSIKLVLDVPSHDYLRLYGATTQRAAVFTKVSLGRSPLVAIKAMQAGTGGLRPALVVLHGPEEPDRLGVEIAKREGIPLALSKASSIEELINSLRSLG